MRSWAATLLLGVMILNAAPVAGKTIYVKTTGASETGPADTCDNTAAHPYVQDAITAADASGDIVECAAGTSWAWTQEVLAPTTHDITITGAGTMPARGAATSGGTTVLVNSTNAHITVYEVTTGNPVLKNITFEYVLSGSKPNDLLWMAARNNGTGVSTLSDYIVIFHHITIKAHERTAVHGLSVTGWPRGLIYRSVFQNDVTWSLGDTANSTGPQLRIGARDPDASWPNASVYGSADTDGNRAVYVEDNEFTNIASGLDLTSGSRAVVRYNTFTDAQIADHGKDSANRGNRTFEVYNNTFSCGAVEWAQIGWYKSRGGTGVITDNIAPGAGDSGCWAALGARWAGTVRVLRTPQGYNKITTTGNTTSGSAVVTNIPSTTGMIGSHSAVPPTDEGNGQQIFGTGIPGSARILSVDSATQITLDQNATANGTGVTLTVADCYGGPYPWLDQSGWGWAGSGDADNQTLEPIYIWNNKKTSGGTAGEADTYIANDPAGIAGGCSFDNSSQVSGVPGVGETGYILENREYYLSTAKPGYSKYDYPHVLATETGSSGDSGISGSVAPRGRPRWHGPHAKPDRMETP